MLLKTRDRGHKRVFLLAETERIRRKEKMCVKGRAVPLNI
jgi:hypothetical protein